LNLAPFTDKHFRIRGLGDTIKDLHNLLYLYPDIPKARTFGKFWTQDVPTIQHGGYVPPALTTVIPGVTDRPPAPLMQYTDDPLSPQSSPYESYAVQTPGSVGTDDTMMNNFDQDELMLADLSTDYNPDDIIDHINVNELIYSTCNNFSQ
jgi:hypothetical protein